MSKPILITLIVVGGVIVMCSGYGLVAYRMWGPMRQTFEVTMACSIHMSDLFWALHGYTDEHGKVPDSDNWQQALAPFLPKDAGVDMPFLNIPPIQMEEPLICHPSNPKTGIALNSEIAGKPWVDVPLSAVVFFEWPEVKMNLSVPFEELPEADSPKVMGTPRGWENRTKAGGRAGGLAGR